MTLSLDALLRTGQMGTLACGMSKQEVEEILGPPDATGGTSRRHPQPSVYLYGTVEIWFRQERPRDLTGIFWEAGVKGIFRLTPACVVADWAFTPEWTFTEVEDYLRDRELPFDYQDSPARDDPTPWLALPSGVTIAFSGGRLYSVLASTRDGGEKKAGGVAPPAR